MFECELISKNDIILAGFSFSGPFPRSFPSEAVKVQQRLGSRKSEFPPSVNTRMLFSPYSVCDSIATYWACYEVQEGDPIPEGMVTFKLSGHSYAKVNCTNKKIGDGYREVFNWMQKNSYTQLKDAWSIELFYIEDTEEELVEILIPVE